MKYDEFVGRVQHRARLGTSGDAVRAIHATLETLGKRLHGDEAQNLAAQLPPEIGVYLQADKKKEAFSLEEFFLRVAAHESQEIPDATHHARAVISVLQEAVSPGEMQNVRAQLPNEYNPLFESGSEGQMSA